MSPARICRPRFRKIFARCEELGLLIFMHPDGFTEARRFTDHYFANVIGNPLEFDRRGASPDLRRGVAGPSRA